MKTRPTEERRKFLLAAGLGSAGAAALAAGVKAKAPGEAPAAEAPAQDGYRLTEHIRKYYKTTQV